MDVFTKINDSSRSVSIQVTGTLNHFLPDIASHRVRFIFDELKSKLDNDTLGVNDVRSAITSLINPANCSLQEKYMQELLTPADILNLKNGISQHEEKLLKFYRRDELQSIKENLYDYLLEPLLDKLDQSIVNRSVTVDDLKEILANFENFTTGSETGKSPWQALTPKNAQNIARLLLYNGEEFLPDVKEVFKEPLIEELVRFLKSVKDEDGIEAVNFTKFALEDSLKRLEGVMYDVTDRQMIDEFLRYNDELSPVIGSISWAPYFPQGTAITPEGEGNYKLVGTAERPSAHEWLVTRRQQAFLSQIEEQNPQAFFAAFRKVYTIDKEGWKATGGVFDPFWGQLNGTNAQALLVSRDEILSENDRKGVCDFHIGVGSGVTSMLMIKQLLHSRREGTVYLVDPHFDTEKVSAALADLGNQNVIQLVDTYSAEDREANLDPINRSFQTKEPHYTGMAVFKFLSENRDVLRRLEEYGIKIEIHPCISEAFFKSEHISAPTGNLEQSHMMALVDGDHRLKAVQSDLNNLKEFFMRVGVKGLLCLDDYKGNYYGPPEGKGRNGHVVNAVDWFLNQSAFIIRSAICPMPERGVDIVCISLEK
jgi:hypothetical protein